MKFKETFIDQLHTMLCNSLKKSSSLYDMLSTTQGVEEFNKVINQIYSYLMEQWQLKQTSSSQRQSSMDPGTLDLNDFMAVMNEIFDDLVDFQHMEIFMLFQVREEISIRDIYLIVCLQAAQQSHQTLEFFYQYGEMVFLALKQYNMRILGHTLRVFCKVFNFDARRVNQVFKTLNMRPSYDYNYEDFEVFCFALCNQETSQGQGQSHSRFTKHK